MSRLAFGHTRRSVQRHRRELRQEAADIRQEAYDKLTLPQKLARAHSRGECSTRGRLTREVARLTEAASA